MTESYDPPQREYRTKGYFLFLFIFLCLMEIFDTYTTQYPNVIVSKVQEQFLSHLDPITADSQMALVVALASVGMLFVVINQVLADFFGRRIFLFITMFGMGIASLCIFFSQTLVQYGIFLFFLYVFFSSDIWTIYITEECRKERRGLNLNLILVFGVIGALLVPTFRGIFLPTDTSMNWQGMTYFAFAAIPLSFAVIGIKETRKFQELKSTRVQKPTPKENFSKFIKPFSQKYRKSFIPILVMSFLQGLNYTFIQLGEAFISDHLSGEQINWVVTAMGLAAIVGYLLTGLLSDKFGRKPMLVIYSILLPSSIALSVFGATSDFAFIALLIGASLASLTYWSLGVVNRLVSIEILPTDIRGTGTAIRSVITAIGTILGGFLNSWLIAKVTLGPSFFIVSLVLLVNVPLILFLIKETKSIELEIT